MKDTGPEIRKLALLDKVLFTKHAIDRIREYGLTVMQVSTMLKRCNHNQKLDDACGHRVHGRAPDSKGDGTIEISAHVRILRESNTNKKILVITVINN